VANGKHVESETSPTALFEFTMTLLGTFDIPGAFLFAKPTKKHYKRLGKDVADVLVRCYPNSNGLMGHSL
jgi:hypothetical protein